MPKPLSPRSESDVASDRPSSPHRPVGARRLGPRVVAAAVAAALGAGTAIAVGACGEDREGSVENIGGGTTGTAGTTGATAPSGTTGETTGATTGGTTQTTTGRMTESTGATTGPE